MLGAGPGPAAGPLLARQPCLLRPGGAGTFAGRGSVPFSGGVWGGRSCAASRETGRSLPALPSRDARPAGLRKRPGFVPLPRPRWPPRGSQPFAALRAEPAKDGVGGGMRLSPSPLTFLFCRRFSVQRCARCHLGISASEMVMRARDLVYHLNCFTCTTCNKMLTTGDHFGMKDNLVYCRLHFETLIQGEYQVHFNHSDVAAGKGPALGAGSANTLGLPYYNGVGTVQKGRPRKRKSPGPGADLAAYNAGKRPPPSSRTVQMVCFCSLPKGDFRLF